jgi:hypothetical protein
VPVPVGSNLCSKALLPVAARTAAQESDPAPFLISLWAAEIFKEQPKHLISANSDELRNREFGFFDHV